MKRQILTIFGIGLLACAIHAEDKKADEKPSPFKDDKEKYGYAIGMSIGNNFKRQDVDVDLDSVAKGLKDTVMGHPTLLSEQEIQEVMKKFQTEMQAKQQEKRKQQSEKNRKEGTAFLEGNKGKSGVITLPSGMQYKVLADGAGESPKATDSVTVNYRGTLIDGTEFDSSIKRGKPATFRVTGVIKGWTEALQMMKPGAKWQLWIPTDLAYGDRGYGPSVPPGAALIFEVELVSVKPPEVAASASGAPLTSDIIKVPSQEELKKGAKIETIKAEDIEKEKAKK